MRNLLLALTTGFLAGEVLSFYRTYTMRSLDREARNRDAVIDAPSYSAVHIERNAR